MIIFLVTEFLSSNSLTHLLKQTASAASIAVEGGDENQANGGYFGYLTSLPGAAVSKASALGNSALDVTGLKKAAAALKDVTNSPQYKFLQSQGIDPLALASTALKNQPGFVGAGAGMVMAAANGESMNDIAKAGLKGALGPMGGIAGAIISGKEEDLPQEYRRALSIGKAGYGLINRQEVEGEDNKQGMMAMAMNLAQLANSGGASEEESKGLMSAAMKLAATASGYKGGQ